VEEAVWAVEVLREVGAPVAVTMCIGPEGDMHDVTPGECAVKLARAGKVSRVQWQFSGCLGSAENWLNIVREIKEQKGKVYRS
jgi:hypothetical protein